MGRLDRAIDREQEFAAHGVEINGVAEPEREGGDNSFGVVADTVEATIHEPLDAPPERVEQRRRREG